MSFWLVKSEPSVYSWEKFESEGKVVWDGVRNYAARNHMRAMKKGDQVLFYHSNEGMEIVGIAKVAKEAYQDPTTTDEAWSCVDLVPFKKLKKPVPHAAMKTMKEFQQLPLIRIPRLSVMPVTKEEFDMILKMAK